MQEQWFNGIRFTIGPGRKYFSNSNVTPRSMHQYVWSYYNGSIPKGYDIHHKDHNRYNNDISNLECIESTEHKRLQGRELTEEQREWRRKNLAEKARPKAGEWHKSEEGRKWHSEHGKESAKHWKPILNVCKQCGVEFETKGKPRKFCSGACNQKYRRDNGLNNIEAICCICGKKFMTDKYSPTKTCSKSCGVTYAWQNGKKGKIGKNNLKRLIGKKGN